MTAKDHYDEAEAALRDKNWDKAFLLYNKAASIAYAPAYVRLGQCYLKGRGAPNDPKMAFACFQAAAKIGSAQAEYMSGYCYKYGYGVSCDEQEAVYWYALAHLHGYQGAAISLRAFGWTDSDLQKLSFDLLESSGGMLSPIQSGLNYPDLTMRYVSGLVSRPITFIRGEDYYLKGRVRSLSYDKAHERFRSIVAGTYDYTCGLQFSGNQLIKHDCNCPAHYEYPGPCKHIIATMLKIRKARLDVLSAVQKRHSQRNTIANDAAAFAQQAVLSNLGANELASGRSIAPSGRDNASESDKKTVTVTHERNHAINDGARIAP